MELFRIENYNKLFGIELFRIGNDNFNENLETKIGCMTRSFCFLGGLPSLKSAAVEVVARRSFSLLRLEHYVWFTNNEIFTSFDPG